MEHPSKLEENLDALLTKLSHLKYQRDEKKIRGDHQINRWMNDLEDCDREVNEIQKRLHELKSGFHPNKFNIRVNLNKKVIKTLKELELLEQEGGGDLKLIQVFITEQKKGTPQQFSREQLIGFTSNDRIGYGGFADVYKGEINGVLVAIKVLKDSAGLVMQRQFMAEVSTMFMTSHRNLVKLQGYCYDPRFKALVYEYMENGSLDKFLYNNQPSIQWEKLYDITIQVAKGLSYLHESCNVPIIHHDVKAANVLLDSNFSPKVTDFGLAKIYKSDKNHATQSQIGGTRIYAAPELLLGSRIVTYHCDIFSFGMLLFEVLQRKMIGEREEWFPWQVWENFEKGQLEKIILGCGIEDKNKDKAYTLSIAALWCTQYNPFDRPSMSTVINVLEGILQLSPPPNPFPYNVSSIRSNTSSVSTTGGSPRPLALSGVSPPSDKWLGEKPSNLETENQVLHQKALAISQTAKALSEVTVILRNPENEHTQSGETRVPLDMTPAPSSFQEPEIEERPQKSLNEEQQQNQDLFIKCISQDLGFSRGRPVAACLVYKCLLHWSSFGLERSSIFDRIIQTIGSFIEVQDNSDTLSYWLSNSYTLLVFLHWTFEAPGEASLSRQQGRTSSASLSGRMSQGFQGRQHEALVFKRQLTTLFEKTYGMINDNLEKEISPILGIYSKYNRETKTSLGRPTHKQLLALSKHLPTFNIALKAYPQTIVDAQQAVKPQVQSVVEILNNYLRTLTANYIPPYIVRMVFSQIFSFIKTQLSYIDVRLAYINNEFMKLLLHELEKWCISATDEFAELACYQLSIIKEAYQDPDLPVRRLKYIRPLPISYTTFSVDVLLKSVRQIDIADVDPPLLLRKSPGFAFLLKRAE